ncbi:hypothetical protein NDU88_007737 [Pleurodeles waltl]|uniref:Uncharacterized protein n=1 Tax=Pleurodeles waltl TaxID=8319 RepID=A0AAV7VTQ7_PLEWA|nr:hypothetical protein NDU88_007737 [Pleurodeles waltl]
MDPALRREWQPREEVLGLLRLTVVQEKHLGAALARVLGQEPDGRRVRCAPADRRGEGVACASFSKSTRAHQVLVPQAPLALESGGEHGNQTFEEKLLGGAANMAAPSELNDLGVEEESFPTGEGSHIFMAEQAKKDVIVIDSEEEGEVLELQIEEDSGIGGHFDGGLSVHSDRVRQQTPKMISQVGQGVQEWEVEDQYIFRTGGQVFFQDGQGMILKGTICGLASEYGGSGTAQLGQNFLGQDQRAYLSGCVAPHVSSGHGVLVEHQLSGRPAGGPIAVGVRAPPGRRIEERVQSGAVRLTAREVTPLEVRSFESRARVESRSYSRSTILGGEEEEELDYGDDGEQVEAPKASTSGQAFQGERLSRREVAGNLSRGEGFDTGNGGLALGGTRSGVQVLKKMDVAIQAGGEGNESKVGDSMSTVQEVTGKAGVDQALRVIGILFTQETGVATANIGVISSLLPELKSALRPQPPKKHIAANRRRGCTCHPSTACVSDVEAMGLRRAAVLGAGLQQVLVLHRVYTTQVTTGLKLLVEHETGKNSSTSAK